MTIVLSALADRSSGEVHRILDLPDDSQGLRDLSQANWGDSRAIIRGLAWTRIRVEGATIRPSLVECRLTNCEFRECRSEGHFWGAENAWEGCALSNVELIRPICPQNFFDQTQFTEVSLVGLDAYETVFKHCTFSGFTLEGFAAKRSLRPRKPFPELGSAPCSVAFVDCVFDQPVFERCMFAHVGFFGCDVREPQVRHCGFDGAVGDAWWRDVEAGNPRLGFVDALLECLEQARPGAGVVQQIRDFRASLETGEGTPDDYDAIESACPDEELDLLEGCFDRVKARVAWDF
ncbi:MAG: hypothetical protein R3F62_26805 [Planctomycetota bacterium]